MSIWTKIGPGSFFSPVQHQDLFSNVGNKFKKCLHVSLLMCFGSGLRSCSYEAYRPRPRRGAEPSFQKWGGQMVQNEVDYQITPLLNSDSSSMIKTKGWSCWALVTQQHQHGENPEKWHINHEKLEKGTPTHSKWSERSSNSGLQVDRDIDRWFDVQLLLSTRQNVWTTRCTWLVPQHFVYRNFLNNFSLKVSPWTEDVDVRHFSDQDKNND